MKWRSHNHLKGRGIDARVENSVHGTYGQWVRVQDFVVGKEGHIEDPCGFICRDCYHYLGIIVVPSNIHSIIMSCHGSPTNCSMLVLHVIIVYAILVGERGHALLFLLSSLSILHSASLMCCSNIYHALAILHNYHMLLSYLVFMLVDAHTFCFCCYCPLPFFNVDLL